MRVPKFLAILSAISAILGSHGSAQEKLYSGKRVRALLVTGGCCHNYAFQAKAMTEGISKQADIEWKVINEGGTGTRAEISLYDDPAWAKPFDVVVHNECFADATNSEYVKKVVAGHAGGTPAVVVHCAMHTYRALEADDWREFLGVTSMHHEHQSTYPVKIVANDHPTMRGFSKDWVTPMDELYIIKKLWPTAKALATSVSEKNGAEQPVVWTNDHKGTRIFGTTYGHSDATFRDPIFINLLTRGVLWAAGKLE